MLAVPGIEYQFSGGERQILTIYFWVWGSDKRNTGYLMWDLISKTSEQL